MTSTGIRSRLGFSNGREASLFKVAQTSAAMAFYRSFSGVKKEYACVSDSTKHHPRDFGPNGDDKLLWQVESRKWARKRMSSG